MKRTSPENDHNCFRAEEPGAPRYYIEGRLSLGVLSFTVVAVVNGRRGRYTGRQIFDAMMEWIGTRRIKVIRAFWTDSQKELTKNLDIFNQETKRSAAHGQENQVAAAFATKTGQWAKAYNFKVVQSINVRPIGVPGGYEQVEVDYVRPQRKKR